MPDCQYRSGEYLGDTPAAPTGLMLHKISKISLVVEQFPIAMVIAQMTIW